MTKDEIKIAQEKLAQELAVGTSARLAEIEALVERRKKLGLSLICTADELDATPLLPEESYD